MLIAVPGWPLPTFWTASMASTRTVSIARRSSSPKPSGRVGWGCAGRPVGLSVAASAGASDPVLCVMWWVLPRLGPESAALHVWCAVPRAGAGPGHTVLVDVAPTRSAAGSTLPTLVTHAHAAPDPGDTRATVTAGPLPGFERGSCCPGARRGDGTVRASDRVHPPPARRAGSPSGRLHRAHQAADHRAAAGHDGAGDDARGRRLAVVEAAAVHPRRRHAGGRGGQRLQLLLRPRHRQADAPDAAAAAAVGRGHPAGSA